MVAQPGPKSLGVVVGWPRMLRISSLSPPVLLLSLSIPVASAEEPADKSRYHPFHPTPRELLREMSTDRPDQTESPYTVDAGHFQLELDFVNVTLDRDRSGGGDVRSESWGVGALNLKIGLSNRVDVQFVAGTHLRTSVEDRVAGTVDRASGFGDVQTRLKVNFWGNDGGRTAFGMMPFVKWPLSRTDLRNGESEGGVIFPFALDLGGGWGLGAMTEVDVVAGADDDHETEFINSVTVGHDLTERLGMYVELFSVTGSAPGFRRQGQAGVGWTHALGDDAQLDFGCNFGVTSAAPDFNPFVGLSVRY